MKGNKALHVIVVLFVLILMLSSLCSAQNSSLPLCEMTDAAGWKGLTPDPTVTYQGSAALKWTPAQSPAASIDNIPHDWSSYNVLSFALHSTKATKKVVLVVLGSETSDTEGYDFYTFKVYVDWTGWKEFNVPFNEFHLNRLPVGWNKIDSIKFEMAQKDIDSHPDAVFHIANLQLKHEIFPSISDTELFSILNLDYPGLEKVKSAVDSGDLSSAKHEFAEYLRHREKPVWKIDWKARPRHATRPAGVDTKDADRVLNRELPSCSHWQKYDGKINWNLNPINYLEWPWQLSRHHFWVWLGEAYWATGEEKYAKEWVYQLTDWITQCAAPRYTSGNDTYTWRTIEAGGRTGRRWMESYHLFLTSPSFTDDAIIMMIKSFVEHARVLMRWYTGGNWICVESNGLMHVGVMFPEFKEAESWRKTASERLFVELNKQVYPDGVQQELSTMYHQVTLEYSTWAWEIAHLNDVKMPDEYVTRIEKLFDYNVKAAMPNGFLPGLNDADCKDIRYSLEKGLLFFPDREDFKWFITDGKSGKKPAVGSVAFPFAGQFVMRTGWDEDDLYMMCDFGPFGTGHHHEDNLSIVIYSHGKYHLVDPGNYAYDGTKWRAHIVSTPAHNTILVDGLGQNRRAVRETYKVSKPLPNKWIAGDTFDYLRGAYDSGYGAGNKTKVTHTRNVFFVKPEYWIVTDFLDPEDSAKHLYESMFHVDAEGFDKGVDHSFRTINKGSSNLSIIPLAEDGLCMDVVSGQEEPTLQGWMPYKPYTCRPIPTPIFKKEASGPAHFMYVLYPTAQGKECPIDRIEPIRVRSMGGSKAVGAVIRFADGRKDYYVQSTTPGQMIKFLDYETDASAVYIRTEKDAVKCDCMAGGTALRKTGKVIDAEIRVVEDLSLTEAEHKR